MKYTQEMLAELHEGRAEYEQELKQEQDKAELEIEDGDSPEQRY